MSHPGPDAVAAQDSELIFKYVDDWKWGTKMSLRNPEVAAHRSKTQNLVAIGTWGNSVMHGSYGEDKVVGDTLSAIEAGRH
jgi:hypothetical protein